MRRCLPAFALLFLGHAALARAPGVALPTTPVACQTAIATAERQRRLPEKLLGTIALVESGRPDPGTGRATPWPWTINVEGAGHVYADKAGAIEAVRDLQAAGVRSIDVGCMQINLAAHPQAFETLEDAFDPAVNADYAARFLRALTQQTGRIAVAMTAYHSQTPSFAADYARRLLAIWPGAAALGLTADPAPQAPPAVPSPYTAAFASQLAQDRIAVPARKRAPSSQLGVVSSHGEAWPTRARPSLLNNQ